MKSSMFCILAGLGFLGVIFANPLPAETRVDDALKTIIPKATGISTDDLRRMSANPPPRLEDFENQSLSLVFLFLTPATDPKEPSWKEFHYLDSPPKPAKLTEVISQGNFPGFGTLLQPSFIKEMTCTVRNKVAMGTISFQVEKLCEGRVEFTARKTDKGWRMDEFRLPGYGVRVYLNQHSKWKRDFLKRR